MAIAIPSRKAPPIRVRYLLAGGFAVVIAAAGVVGAWQFGSSGGAGASVREAVSVSRPVEPDIVWYVVTSQAQADLLIRGEDDAARIRAAAGEVGPLEAVEVVIANDNVSLERELRAYFDANWIRNQAGLPEMKLVDLRDGAN